jgi:hypothetical protein
MKILKTISIFSLLVFVSCAVEQEDLPIIQDQLFYNKMDKIFENPSIYALLEPKNINPFEVDFSTLISESGLKKNNGIQTNLFGSVPPEDIINADSNFQNLSNILIDKSLILPRDEFLRLAYAVEVEVIRSSLSEVKKETLLKELAVLKGLEIFLKKGSNNARIQCDFKLECDILVCVENKVKDALSEELHWLERLINTFNMPKDLPLWWVYCTLQALEND